MPLSWAELLKRTMKETLADDVASLAAQQAYYFFFALFPALLALIAFASFFPIHNLIDEVVRVLSQVAPQEVIEIVTDQIQKISQDRSGGLLTFAFLFTLWSSSNAVMAMVTTLNAAYDVTESRPWWKTRLLAIGLTVGLALFVLISMTLVIAGPRMAEQLASAFGLGAAFVWTWWILQWPIVFILIATGIALVYYFAPDADQDWVWLTPGSILATGLWLLVSLGFKAYLQFAGNFTETYGALAGVMVLLLWFYLSGLAILVGAELNAVIEHASPYGKDVGEKAPGEKKAIGPAAERAAEELRARGELPVPPFPEGTNCDLDRLRAIDSKAVRPSELLIGAAVLLPIALKIGRDVKRKLTEDEDRAA